MIYNGPLNDLEKYAILVQYTFYIISHIFHNNYKH